MKPVIFRVGAGKRGALPERFFLNIPFAGRKRGKPGILCKLQMIIQHEDQDEMVAAAGAVIFKSAEMLDITVRQIRHGCGGKKNIF